MRKNWKMNWVLTASCVVCVGPGVRVCDAQFFGQPQGSQSQIQQQQQQQLQQPQIQQQPALQSSMLQSPALQTPVQQSTVLSYGGQQAALPPQPKASWTQRLTSVFTGKKNPAVSSIARTAPPIRSQSSLHSFGSAFGSEPSVASAEYTLSLAKQSEQSGDSDQARSLYQQALTTNPNNLEGMLALARLEDREGQLNAALHYYLQAVKSHPQSTQALNDLSLCFARRGQLAEALQPLQDAIRLQPTKALYRNNIAKVLTEMNRVSEATQHLSAVHPPAVAQYNMGVLLHQRGRDNEAASYLTAATQLDPSLVAAGTLLTELSNGAAQNAQQTVASNDHILPTPRTVTPGQAYPSTGIGTATARYQNVPAETAQLPVGNSPVLLPPVR